MMNPGILNLLHGADSKADLRLRSDKNYFAVLIAQKQLGFVQESIKRLEKLSADMSAMYKNGFVEKLDIDKTTVSLNNTNVFGEVKYSLNSLYS